LDIENGRQFINAFVDVFESRRPALFDAQRAALA
jgi:hypothetical protein